MELTFEGAALHTKPPQPQQSQAAHHAAEDSMALDHFVFHCTLTYRCLLQLCFAQLLAVNPRATSLATLRNDSWQVADPTVQAAFQPTVKLFAEQSPNIPLKPLELAVGPDRFPVGSEA